MTTTAPLHSRREERLRRSPAPTPVRRDIQALRALAVGLVVLYHFWPKRVTGGFVGVDVFFVISGFLITTHLIAKPPRSLRDLAEFWGRRIRRLLPASFLVLATTTAAIVSVAPTTMWELFAKHIAGSAFYVENWLLAADAVDYSAADNAATPVQHFWSLSVEEQFYFVWPILVLVVGWFASRFARDRGRALLLAISIVVVASGIASVVLSANDPGAAYFVSSTRAWELGAGGLAACVFPAVQRLLGERRGPRELLAWLGLAAVLFAALRYDGSTPFPSFTAALPVAGTMLVLLASAVPARHSPLRLAETRPVQLVGDLSYSIYLWHWPVVILLPLALGHSLSWPVKLAAIALVTGLAWLTKIHVEDRFRGRRPLGDPLRRSFLFAIVGMLAIAALCAALATSAALQREAAARQLASVADGDDRCFAAAALLDDGCAPHGEKLLTDPNLAAADKSDAYADGCWVTGDFSQHKRCEYGSTARDAKRIALVGNSHGGHWLPALQHIAEERDWHITTYLANECYTVDAPIKMDNATASENCRAWNRHVIDDIVAERYDLVVISNRTARPFIDLDRPQTLAAATPAYRETLRTWANAGLPVIVLRDTPYAVDVDNVPDCVAQNLDDLSACDGTRTREVPDPLADAAAELSSPHVTLLDLTDRICRDDTCYSVVGGTIVYFDRGHLTATFARSLAPAILAAADELLTD